MNEELVNLHMKAKTKEEAIKELARNVESAKRIENYEEYVVSVFERENMTSTGIGFKIAIPHGKSSTVKSSTVAFGRLEEDIAMVTFFSQEWIDFAGLSKYKFYKTSNVPDIYVYE